MSICLMLRISVITGVIRFFDPLTSYRKTNWPISDINVSNLNWRHNLSPVIISTYTLYPLSYLKFLPQLVQLIRGKGCARSFIIRQAGVVASAGSTAQTTATAAQTAAAAVVWLPFLLHFPHPVNIKSWVWVYLSFLFACPGKSEF